MPLRDISEFACVHPGLSMHACVGCSVWCVHACGRVQVRVCVLVHIHANASGSECFTSSGRPAIFAYARACGTTMSPTVIPAMTSERNLDGEYLRSHLIKGTFRIK